MHSIITIFVVISFKHHFFFNLLLHNASFHSLLFCLRNFFVRRLSLTNTNLQPARYVQTHFTETRCTRTALIYRKCWEMQLVFRKQHNSPREMDEGWERESWQDTLCLSGPEEFNGMRFDLAPYDIFAICEMPKHCIFYHAKSSGREAGVCSVNVPEQTLELIFLSNETQRPRMWGADDVWL